jgi:hypothetical protein
MGRGEETRGVYDGGGGEMIWLGVLGGTVIGI